MALGDYIIHVEPKIVFMKEIGLYQKIEFKKSFKLYRQILARALTRVASVTRLGNFSPIRLLFVGSVKK
jgi:hypothetical protein